MNQFILNFKYLSRPKNSIRILSFFLLVNTILLFPQDKFNFTGYGAAGFRVYDRNQLRKYNQEAYYEGKLQFNYTVNKHIEAQIDMRGNSDDDRIVLREFSAKFEYIKLLKLKIGNIKKPFGSEGLLEREEMATMDRSLVQQTISDYGYGGRGVSLMAYYNYNKKRSEFPYSYFVSFFKDNSLNAGMVLRGSYHFDDFAASVNYAYLNKGGEYSINGNAFCLNFDYENEEGFKSGLALFYARDPYESIRRQHLNLDEMVYSAGLNLSTSKKFQTEAEIVKTIEPVLLVGYFLPDSKESKYNTFEAIIGCNFYLHKDVRIRLHGDLLMTKSIYTDSFSSVGSKVMFEIQVCF